VGFTIHNLTNQRYFVAANAAGAFIGEPLSAFVKVHFSISDVRPSATLTQTSSHLAASTSSAGIESSVARMRCQQAGEQFAGQ
jgi:hypothetical protein